MNVAPWCYIKVNGWMGWIWISLGRVRYRAPYGVLIGKCGIHEKNIQNAVLTFGTLQLKLKAHNQVFKIFPTCFVR